MCPFGGGVPEPVVAVLNVDGLDRMPRLELRFLHSENTDNEAEFFIDGHLVATLNPHQVEALREAMTAIDVGGKP